MSARSGSPDPAQERRDQHARLIGVALHLHEGERRLRIAPVRPQHAGAGIPPALVDWLATIRQAIIGDVSSLVLTRFPLQPAQCAIDIGAERLEQIEIARRFDMAGYRDQEQQRRVDGGVARRLRHLVQMGQFADPQLVQDLARLFTGLLVVLPALPVGECLCRAGPERRIEGEALDRRQQAIPAEQSHEPRYARRSEPVLPSPDLQQCKIGERAGQHLAERLARRVYPSVAVQQRVRRRFLRLSHVTDAARRPRRTGWRRSDGALIDPARDNHVLRSGGIERQLEMGDALLAGPRRDLGRQREIHQQRPQHAVGTAIGEAQRLPVPFRGVQQAPLARRRAA